jgi:hypothetical protein
VVLLTVINIRSNPCWRSSKFHQKFLVFFSFGLGRIFTGHSKPFLRKRQENFQKIKPKYREVIVMKWRREKCTIDEKSREEKNILFRPIGSPFWMFLSMIAWYDENSRYSNEISSQSKAAFKFSIFLPTTCSSEVVFSSIRIGLHCQSKINK